MATFAQYFKVCKEEAEIAEVNSTVTEDETLSDVKAELTEASSELKESCDEADKAEEVIANTQEQIDAQKQALEKPEEVTPAQVVLASESFRANLRLLGIDSSYISSLNYVNSETITSSPAQVLSLITVDMEGFLDTAKNVAGTIRDKIVALFKWIAGLFKKFIGLFQRNVDQVEKKVSDAVNEVEKAMEAEKKSAEEVEKGLGYILTTEFIDQNIAIFAAMESFKTGSSGQVVSGVWDLLGSYSDTMNDIMGQETKIAQLLVNQELSTDKIKGFFGNLKNTLVGKLPKYDNKPIGVLEHKKLKLLDIKSTEEGYVDVSSEAIEIEPNKINISNFTDKPIGLKYTLQQILKSKMNITQTAKAVANMADSFADQAAKSIKDIPNTQKKEKLDVDETTDRTASYAGIRNSMNVIRELGTGYLKSVQTVMTFTMRAVKKNGGNLKEEEKK